MVQSILSELFQANESFFDQYFPSESSYVSKEVMKILDHPGDREKYIDASDKLRKGSRSETITLHSGEKIIICRT